MDFSIPDCPFNSIFNSKKQKALVGMTDDEVAYIEAKGWKASVVPELSIIHHVANFCGSNAGAFNSSLPDADLLQNLPFCPLLGVVRSRAALSRWRAPFRCCSCLAQPFVCSREWMPPEGPSMFRKAT